MKILTLILIIFCATQEKVKGRNISEEDKVKAKHLYIRASAYLNQERYNEAIPLLNDAKALDPYFVEAYIALGNAYLSLKDTQKARENFLEVTRIFPNDKRGYQGLGFLYGVYLRNYEKGIYFYKRCYEIDKTDLSTLLIIAHLFEKINKDSAEFYYIKILGFNPEHPEALKKYLNFLVDEKRFQEALIYANRAIEKLSNDETVMESAFKVYIQMGEARKAIKIADELIKKNPNDYIYYLMRGTAFASINDYKNALSDYNKAESLNPKSVGVYVRKALLYNDLKDYNKSLIEGKKALDLQPKSEEVLSAVYYVVAEGYKGLALNSEEKKNWDQALDLWEKAKTWYSRIYSLGDTPYRDYSLKMVEYTSKKWEKVKRIKLGIDEG